MRYLAVVVVMWGLACRRQPDPPSPQEPLTAPAPHDASPSADASPDSADHSEPAAVASASTSGSSRAPGPDAGTTHRADGDAPSPPQPAPADDVATTRPRPSSPSTPSKTGSSLDHAEGMTKAEVERRFGKPDERAGNRWVYRRPKHSCAEVRIVYTLTFRADEVTTVARTRKRTGQHCQPNVPGF